MRYLSISRAIPLAAVLAATTSSAVQAHMVKVGNLVSDDATEYPAQITDPGLINAWGVSYGPTGPFWVSSNGAGTSPLYRVDPLTQVTTKVPLTVAIPGDGSVTGQVFNGAGGFNGDIFLFASEDGVLSGWRGALGTTAEILKPNAPAVYKGLAVGTIGTDSYAYGANFAGGKIDIFKGNSASPDLTGAFTDPGLTEGYAPFNIQNLNGKLYVTYARQSSDPTEEQKGAGLGVVSVFDLSGAFLGRIASGGPLNAPWGLAIAPSSFGDVAGSLLVGNFGDGRINAYDTTTNDFLGQILGADGKPVTIDGLWALTVGNDTNAGSSQRIYFSAGPDDETHGLFGVLTTVPEPGTWMLNIAGFGLIGTMLRRRPKAATRLA